MQPHLRKRSERLAAREAKWKISQGKGGNVQVPKDAAKSIHKIAGEIRREMSRRDQADRKFNEKSRAKIAQPYRGQRGGRGTESYGDFATIRFDGGGCVRPNLNIRVKHIPSRTWKYYEEGDMQDEIEWLKKDRFGYPKGFGEGGPPTSFDRPGLHRPFDVRAQGDFIVRRRTISPEYDCEGCERGVCSLH